MHDYVGLSAMFFLLKKLNYSFGQVTTMSLRSAKEEMIQTLAQDAYWRKKFGHTIESPLESVGKNPPLIRMADVKIQKKKWRCSKPTLSWIESTKAIITDRIAFKHEFAKIIAGCIKDFNNILVAGGSVGSIIFGAEINDIDIFVYGLTMIDATHRVYNLMQDIVEKFPQSRLANTPGCTTIITPQFKVQIIHRLYKSAEEILYGFDIGSCAVGFDGQNVLFTVLSKFSFEYMCNILDVTRRSTTYEKRLAKYMSRGFNLILPKMNMPNIRLTSLAYDIEDVCELPYFTVAYSDVKHNEITISRMLTKFNNASDYLDYTPRKHIRASTLRKKHFKAPGKYVFILDTPIAVTRIVKIDWLVVEPWTQINGSINPANISEHEWYGEYYRSH